MLEISGILVFSLLPVYHRFYDGILLVWHLGEVRPNALERAPFQAFGPVGHDVFLRRVETVSHGTARRLRPEGRKAIVGASAKKQIKLLAIPRQECFSASGGPIG